MTPRAKSCCSFFALSWCSTHERGIPLSLFLSYWCGWISLSSDLRRLPSPGPPFSPSRGHIRLTLSHSCPCAGTAPLIYATLVGVFTTLGHFPIPSFFPLLSPFFFRLLSIGDWCFLLSAPLKQWTHLNLLPPSLLQASPNPPCLVIAVVITDLNGI